MPGGNSFGKSLLCHFAGRLAEGNRIRDRDGRGVRWTTFHGLDVMDINDKPFDASGWPLTGCGLPGPPA
jgi:hypothetical protein